MREIRTHIVEGDSLNHQLEIEVIDEPGLGGTNHLYMVRHSNFAPAVNIPFQNGPIAEVGVNGISNEALLAIVIDRLEGFSKGPFPSDYSNGAMNYCRLALMSLQNRTRDRLARGVEGTLQK